MKPSIRIGIPSLAIITSGSLTAARAASSESKTPHNAALYVFRQKFPRSSRSPVLVPLHIYSNSLPPLPPFIKKSPPIPVPVLPR